MLCDTNFLVRMREFDATQLRNSPELASYIADVYFSTSGGSSPSNLLRSGSKHRASVAVLNAPRRSAAQNWATLRRGSSSLLAAGRQIADTEEPLSVHRVRRASTAAGALFGWCTAVLVEALELPVPAAEEEEPPPPSPLNVLAPFDAGPEEEEEPRGPVPRPNLPPERPPPKPLREIPKITPKPVLAPPKKIPQDKPDRHFEVLVPFELGHSGITDEGEISLQDVCALKCMRQRLNLEIVGSPAQIENDALAESRIKAVMDFFQQQGLRPLRSIEKSRPVPMDKTPGIICQFLLDDDRELRDFFIYREMGEPFKPPAATMQVINSLERDCEMLKH